MKLKFLLPLIALFVTTQAYAFVEGETDVNDGGTVYKVIPVSGGSVQFVTNGTVYTLDHDQAVELKDAMLKVKAGGGEVQFQVGPVSTGVQWDLKMATTGVDAGKMYVQPITQASNAAYAISLEAIQVLVDGLVVVL